ncbi:MAG: ATP-dependent zinc metalloprotease FtsH [Parcubacteria group bacterium]|nr:ATP-dependent zinc metalloprotease FtsH [Parcubacteria group bacterium]
MHAPNLKNKGKNLLGGPGKGKLLTNALTAILVFLLIITAYSVLQENKKEIPEVSLSELSSDVLAGKVKEIVIAGDKLNVTYGDETEKVGKKELESTLTDTLSNYGVSGGALSKIKLSVENPKGFSYWALSLAPFLIPILFLIFFFWLLTRQVKGAGMQAFTFGQSKARVVYPDDKGERVTFKDVAGVKEAKEELAEIVDFLKNPKKFLDIGARIPKGVLLMGAPGTGKTLLARAVSGEARVPFFSISGSEFVEMFVGVGASRVRDLFQLAKKAAPSIIFVDEIDAVGRVRGAGVGGGNDEREQTLNQILVEMDGFEPHEKVIVIAASNRPDVLDPALLRPGRFDRRVILDLPDINDREAILTIHGAKKPFTDDVKIRIIAERTPGFSGADLYSLMNEAAIYAARANRKKVSQRDLINAIEKVLLGPERKSHLLSVKEKRITAYHEAGHALVASLLPNADPVHKVSIVSRGHAGGYTLKLPYEEKRLQTRKEFLDDIAVALGGYVAEKMIFDDLTTGPSSDLRTASALAHDMVTKYGMSDVFGPIVFEEPGGRMYLGADGFSPREYSEDISAKVDAEATKIISEAVARAENLIRENRKALDAIADALTERETLEHADFEKILEGEGITPKKREVKEVE